MKLSFRKKLNQLGMLSLHALIPIVLAVVAVGGIGAYVLTKSQAAAALTSNTCYLRGRVWTNGSCAKTCISGAGEKVAANPYAYCSKALSKITRAECIDNGRKWLDVGCARRWQQTNFPNAPQCKVSGSIYFVGKKIDKCLYEATP